MLLLNLRISIIISYLFTFDQLHIYRKIYAIFQGVTSIFASQRLYCLAIGS